MNDYICDDCKMAEHFIKKGRADAIDEFVELLKEDILHAIFDSRNSLAERIEDIAEQLKEQTEWKK